VADCVREAESRRAVIDRRAEERGQHLGPRAGGVLGDVRHRQARLHRDVDRLRAALGDEVHVPLLRVLANGARADERVDLDRQPRLLRKLDHRRDVADHRATGARDLDLHLAVDDLPAEAQHVLEGALGASRKADVRLVDAEVFHQVQDLQLVVDARILDRGVLQAVAERLVEQRETLRNDPAFAIDLVPVEDELSGAVGLGGSEVVHS
jgi:hypothetical protein